MTLGYLQRGGSPSAFDRLLASRFGKMAVHLVAQGKIDHMVALQEDKITSVPIAKAVEHHKLVPLDSDLIRTAFGLGLCLGNTREAIENMRQSAISSSHSTR
jgi:6-phosphofructokinase 1